MDKLHTIILRDCTTGMITQVKVEELQKLPLGIDLDNYRISHSMKKKICLAFTWT